MFISRIEADLQHYGRKELQVASFPGNFTATWMPAATPPACGEGPPGPKNA